MSSNLKVNTILPSTGTAIGIGTLSGNVDVFGHIVGHNTPNISGINSVTASHFYGDGSNLTGITQTTINNNANNRIITGSGTANTLEGEANLTWDGAILSATGSDAQLRLYDSTASSENSALRMMAYNGVNFIQSGKAFSSDSKADLIFGSMFGGTEWIRIDSSGRLLIGTTATDNRDGYNSSLQVAGTGGDDSSISIGRYSADTSYPALVFSKSRNAAINSHTRVNTGDYLGGIQFQGDDGTRFLVGASIVAQAASPVADYDMATDLIISTNSGTTSPNKSMTLDHQGRFTKPNTPFVMVHINTTSNRNSSGSQLIVPWDIIHGRSTNSNVGSHFNTSNHRFTAPVDGRYLFVLSLNEVGNNIVYHRVNNTQVSYAEYREGGSQWDHMDASFIYDMNANDYYETWSLLTGTGQRFNGGGSANGGWDTLSIYLLG